MIEQTTATKFPETISPENMCIGKKYLLAIHHSDSSQFQTIGPFTINDRARRHKDGRVSTHYCVQAFMTNERRSRPRGYLVLPLAGHSSIRGKKMSLHVHSEEVAEYFLNRNKQNISHICKEAD